ncbi:kinesin-like protein KIF11-A [Trichonephila clavata]|uniref:Kinesin-like protein KIF11-A n=1 Tax=Trichonephila clavata TaxID=2740835 RepID=A0A8X6HM21_TRICU|nr:kinesin-like protein KIF11-A [Trichonephila clavata]
MSKKTDNPKNQRIQVFARCRPLNSIEKRQFSPSVVEVIPEKKEILLKDRNTSREFFFDKVFPPDAKQINVYKAVVGPLIQEVLNGYNCTVFAYGQTGTGKTYTMEGERNNSNCSWEDDPGAGIIPRSLHQLFEELNKEENVEFSVRVSFLELYNEELFDLLSSTELSRLRLYEDSNRKGSVIIQGLEEIMVNNKDEVYAILEKGTARRQTAATMLNATSSRSHTVFSVTVHIKENTVEGEELLKTGKLNLVDLAGSENVGRSGAIEKRAREAGNINQSLLTLGRVITALIEKQPHIPYRESKLTRLLQDSLGGHTKTSIIATISPALCNFDETISTLDYATKAKSITIRPEVNQKMTKRALIREYTEEIERLRRDLTALRNKEGFFIDSDNYTALLSSVSEKENLIKEFEEKIEILKEENKKIEELFNTTKEELMKTSEQLTETVKKYEETASELTNTTSALDYTKDVLAKTALDRDEKEYLINIQKKTESKLTQQAQMLLQVANETTSDVNKLHEKIDRKKIVERMNEDNCQDFRIMHQKQCAKLDDIITDDKNMELYFLQSVRGDLDQIMNGFLEYKQKLSTCLQGIFTSAELNLQDFSSNLSKETSNQKQWASAVFDNMIFKQDELVASQQKFLTEKLPSLFAQLDVANSELFSLFQNNHNKLCQKINQHKNTVEVQLAKEKDLLCSMNNTLDSFFKNHLAVVDDLTKHSKSALHSKKEREMKVKKIAADLAKNLEDLNSYIKLEEADEDLLEFEEYKQKLNNVVDDIRPVQEAIHILKKEKEEEDLSKFDDLINTINMEEISVMKKAAQESQNSASSEIAGILDSSKKKQTESYEELKKAFEIHDSMVKETSQNNHQRINNITSSLSENINTVKCCIEENSKLLKISTEEVFNKVSESEDRRNQITSQIKKEILNLDLGLEKFVSEDIVKDISTGKTPQRKTLSYPTELIATSPLDRVLQRFRSQRAMDTDLAVHLPLESSFNESEESKDTTPEDISNGVNSHNVSITSEDYDSTGCETDSNASSVSDSVESGKNKENKAKKTSRLPKKLPKFTKFAKPAPPPPRKPLISANSDMDSSII